MTSQSSLLKKEDNINEDLKENTLFRRLFTKGIQKEEKQLGKTNNYI